MESIEQMIKRLCPEGVEWKSFSEIGSYIRGITYNKAQENNTGDGDGWKVFRANNITLSSNSLNYDDVKVVQKSVKVKETQVLKKHDILICAGSGSKDHIGKVAYINKDMDYTFGGFMGVLRTDEKLALSRYLFHILTSKIFKDYLSETLNSSTINNLNTQIMNDFEIPLPPMEIQARIVEVLDKMTTLEAELEAELDCRKRQYEYYRDKLLNKSKSENEYKRVKLGEIGRVCMCKRVLKEQTTNIGDIPFYKIGTFGKEADAFISKELYEDYKSKYSFPKKGDVLISASGTIGRSVIYDGEPAYYQDSNIVWIANDESKALNKWLFYCYKMSPWKVSTGGTISRLYNDNIANAEIPLPPIAVQERIVNVLDNFEQLCNDLGIGLPAEIEARKLQYEYYRNKLLSFTPPHEITDNQYITLGIAVNDYIKMMQYVFGYVYVPMSEIAEIGTGSSNTNEELDNGLYPFFVRSQIVRFKNEYEYDETAIITSGDGVGVGKVFHFVQGKYALHQRAYRIKPIKKLHWTC